MAPGRSRPTKTSSVSELILPAVSMPSRSIHRGIGRVAVADMLTSHDGADVCRYIVPYNCCVLHNAAICDRLCENFRCIRSYDYYHQLPLLRPLCYCYCRCSCHYHPDHDNFDSTAGTTTTNATVGTVEATASNSQHPLLHTSCANNTFKTPTLSLNDPVL